MVEEKKNLCICDDLKTASLKFMYGWRYCAFCGSHLDTKIKILYAGKYKLEGGKYGN